MAEDDDTDDEHITAILDELLKDATATYIPYETANVQKQMEPKGIRVFSVSALAYTQSRNRFQERRPHYRYNDSRY
jgi:hypothetical protein